MRLRRFCHPQLCRTSRPLPSPPLSPPHLTLLRSVLLPRLRRQRHRLHRQHRLRLPVHQQRGPAVCGRGLRPLCLRRPDRRRRHHLRRGRVLLHRHRGSRHLRRAHQLCRCYQLCRRWFLRPLDLCSGLEQRCRGRCGRLLRRRRHRYRDRHGLNPRLQLGERRGWCGQVLATSEGWTSFVASSQGGRRMGDEPLYQYKQKRKILIPNLSSI